MTLTTAAGAPVLYELEASAFTTEPISMTNLTGATLPNANLDQPLEVIRTSPTR